MAVRWRRWAGWVLDLLFPRRCPWCGRVVGFGQCISCERVVQGLRIPNEPLDLSGKPGITGGLERVFACYEYAKPVDKAILRLKFAGQTGCAGALGDQLASKYHHCRLAGQYDLVLPVPSAPKAERKRGYNHSALLAKRLAVQVKVPTCTGLLVKHRETQRQMKLGREERRKNVADAYRVTTPEKVAGRRVLLVDDVITTGSTLDECGKTLLAAGAACCGALCVATADHAARNQDNTKPVETEE